MPDADSDATPGGKAPSRLLLAHYAEIGLKGGNRRHFERLLSDRLRDGLRRAGVPATVPYRGGRFMVRLRDVVPGSEAEDAALTRALAVLLRTAGVANAAPAWMVPSEIEAIQEAAVLALAQAPPGTFKVESRRADKDFPMTSIDLSRAVAPVCAVRTERTANVRHPDITVRIEVTREWTFVSAARLPGPGGLPVGSAGRLFSFLSGGIDSAVATWLMARRGARVLPVHFHNRTQQGSAVLEKLEDTCRVLAWTTGTLDLHVVPFEACQRAIVGAVPAEYRMIVYRRAMFRIADALARKAKALGFVTGDSLGQVASQTLENLRSIHAAATLPVYAPLAGSDKSEIIALARRIGTFDISIRPHDDCCSFLIARHPATTSRPVDVEAMEEGLDWDELVGEALGGLERLRIEADPDALEGVRPGI